MATTVYEVLDLELQDGTEVKIRPLNLKRLRKVMDIMTDMNKSAEDAGEDAVTQEDTSILDFLTEATKICIEGEAPDLVKDQEKFEEALDLPTMWKILEVAAGISMGPNQQGGVAGLPGLI